jgi:hypothetical protein
LNPINLARAHRSAQAPVPNKRRIKSRFQLIRRLKRLALDQAANLDTLALEARERGISFFRTGGAARAKQRGAR